MQQQTKLQSFIETGKSIRNEIVIRGIKMIDIGYITAIYFILGAVISNILDKVIGEFNEKEAEKKSIYVLYVEVILHFGLLGIIWYITRNIVEYIPFPLDAIHGFDHSKVKELSADTIFMTILVLYQTNLRDKLTYLSEKASNKVKSLTSSKSDEDVLGV